MQLSGKLVVSSIVTIAILLAGASWWFRYNATHRAVHFWGPETVRLIRDAPHVKLYRQPMVPTDSLGVDMSNPDAVLTAIQDHIDASAIDVSRAPGLLHLRNALLEDSSYVWPPTTESYSNDATETGYWWLSFTDTRRGKTTTIWFSRDCTQALRLTPNPERTGTSVGTAISTEPIAAGLMEVFADFTELKSKPEFTPAGAMP